MALPVPQDFGPPPPNTQDPMEIIRHLFDNPPDFGSQAADQVGQIFAPQYGQINAAEQAAKNRAGQNDKQLQALYNALVAGIAGDRGQIGKTYDSSIAGVNQAYAQGKNSVRNAYSNANNEVASILQKLGIQSAGADPRLFAQNAADSAFMQNVLAANNQGSTNALNQQKSSTLNWNTAQQGAARAAGTEARTSLQQALEQRLAEFANNRLALDSQVQQNIFKTQQDLQQNWMAGQQKLADQTYQSWQDQLKASQAQQGTPLNEYQKYQMLGPVDKTYSQATQITGDPGKANSAVAMMSQMAAGQNGYNSPFQFIEDAVKLNQQSNSGISDGEMRAIAGFFWEQMNPNSLPSYVQSSPMG